MKFGAGDKEHRLASTYDVVIIGSGYGGAIPAMRLAAAGMKVLVLERGPRRRSQDLLQSDSPKYIQSVMDYFVSSANVGYRTGNQMGGASINMDGAFYRAPTRTLEHRDEDGRRIWPEKFDRAFLDPYYQRIEAKLRVRPMAWNEISKAGGLFADLMHRVGRTCNLTLMNYTDCVQCGFCAQGCRFDKKVTLMHSYIPEAEGLGATFTAQANVSHLEKNGTNYVVVYNEAGENKRIEAPRVIVAAGGIYSPALLLRSKPHLGGQLSTHVGENFNTNGDATFVGLLPEGYEGTSDYFSYMGMDNAGVMCFDWFDKLERYPFTLHPGGGFEPAILAANISAGVSKTNVSGLPSKAYGMEYKRFGERVYKRHIIGFSALGLSPAHFAVTLKSDGSADVAVRDRQKHDEYLDQLATEMETLARTTGIDIVDAIPRRYSGSTSAHLLSACRMAESIEHGVVNEDAQVFGQENLYVCDASAVPGALAVNPSLTISAIAEVCADAIIRKG